MILSCREVIWRLLSILLKFRQNNTKTTIGDGFHFTFVSFFLLYFWSL